MLLMIGMLLCLITSSTSALRQHIKHKSDFGSLRLYSAIIPSGICAVYKPKEWTSNDVVTKIKYILSDMAKKSISQATGDNTQMVSSSKKKITLKVGHGGTLDPLAEGVLVLGIGEGTKLLTDYLSGSKKYTTIAKLGQHTDTYDCTGKVISERSFKHIDKDKILSVLPTFTGDIMQVPPMYSALKKNGKKLYELARKGIEVEREARKVTIYNLQLLESESTLPEYFALDIECSGGCYVRSMIVDIAQALDTEAHMTSLVRTKQGTFSVDDCIKQEQWTAENIIHNIAHCTNKVQLDCRSLKPAL